MFDLVIRGGTLVTENSLEPNRGLGIINGRLTLFAGKGPAAREVIDATGKFIAPGFIDLHVHGGGGADFLDCQDQSLELITRFHGKNGTTGLLATIAPAPPARMALALDRVGSQPAPANGAMILGAHLEGPFINPSFHGALNRAFLRKPDLAEAGELLAAGRGKLKMMTLAPELPGSLRLVELLTEGGVLPSLGHSGATLAETIRAGKSGLRHVTHIFNAMAGMHHREPGPASAFLSSEVFSADLIADGVHVHPFFLKLLWQLKAKRLVLISDAISAAGLADGPCLFNGQEITVIGGKATLAGGRLAGSTLTLLEAVKRMIRLAGLSLPQAVCLAAANPARFLGLPRKGEIREAFDADLVLLDQDLNPALVIVGGRVIHRREQ